MFKMCTWGRERRLEEEDLEESVSYLEVEDDCPNEAEGELGVAVHDVLPSDVDQLDLLVPDVQKG